MLNAVMLSVIMLSVVFYCYADCRYDGVSFFLCVIMECIVMLSGSMLSVIFLLFC
jgi:hypothetical protein